MKRLHRSMVLIMCAACALLAPASQVRASEAPLPHLDLDITLDPATREFRAIARLGASRAFRIVLHETLTISDASADGKTIPFTAGAAQSGVREWQLDAPEGALLRIEYGGTLPVLDASLDQRAVLGMTTPMASPRGSFLHAASHWYPEPPSLFSYRVRLTVPGDQRGLVAGHLSEEKLPSSSDRRYSAAFEFMHPAEGIDLMAGPYAIRERAIARAGENAIRVRTYFTADLAQLAESYLDDTARYLQLYAEQIGPYPYREFSIVASPLPTGFGMPTLTYIGAQVLRLPFIRVTSLGHEVLHNWWGNGVYPDYAQGNWSEGLTTFMADYFYKERSSSAAAREMRLSWLRDFAAIPEGVQQPLSAFRSRTHGAEAAVGYGKAAMVFFMLRDLIGEEAFRRGIRSFWQEKRFKTASWNDLRLAFEQASGRSLNAFFGQWVQRAGGPRLAIESATARAGSRSVTITVSQSAPVYTLHVPITLVEGPSTETRWIDIDREKQAVTLQASRRPDHVQLDPDLHLWRVLHEDELPPILRRWMIARAPRLMIASADQDVRSAAIALARVFLEATPQVTDSAAVRASNEPTLLIGLQPDVDRTLARLGLAPRPDSIGHRGTAQVWTVQNRTGPAVAVISAHDASTLAVLQRPLPHYGSQSYLVFEGSKVVDRGVWPAAGRATPVSVR